MKISTSRPCRSCAAVHRWSGWARWSCRRRLVRDTEPVV